jgi:hypothetical protein
MIYLTQLIYIQEGQESIFHQFEDIAIPIIPKYNGQIYFVFALLLSRLLKIVLKNPMKYI